VQAPCRPHEPQLDAPLPRSVSVLPRIDGIGFV
jgi:hypothetical protein